MEKDFEEPDGAGVVDFDPVIAHRPNGDWQVATRDGTHANSRPLPAPRAPIRKSWLKPALLTPPDRRLSVDPIEDNS
jgi:hypothetical protein